MAGFIEVSCVFLYIGFITSRLKTLILSIADCKQLSCYYTQTAIQGVVFSETLYLALNQVTES